MTLRGKVDATTGMLFNLSDLKKYLEEVAQQIDHKNIDKDIPFFLNHPSTSENLAIFVWEALKEKFQKPELLYEVKRNKIKLIIEVSYRFEKIIQWPNARVLCEICSKVENRYCNNRLFASFWCLWIINLDFSKIALASLFLTFDILFYTAEDRFTGKWVV